MFSANSGNEVELVPEEARGVGEEDLQVDEIDYLNRINE